MVTLDLITKGYVGLEGVKQLSFDTWMVPIKAGDNRPNMNLNFQGGEGVLFFKHGETQRNISIPIIDDLEFEKD